MRNKFVRTFTPFVLTAFLVSGCTSSSDSSSDTTNTTETVSSVSKTGVKISMLNSKGEIQSNLEEVARLYTARTGVELEIMAAPSGTSPFEKISAMYSSGNPPTMAMVDTTDAVALAKEKSLDLSDEKWVQDAMAYEIDGKVYSFPLGVEGKGLIYNKTVVEKVLGHSFDPKEINTVSELKSIFDQLQGFIDSGQAEQNNLLLRSPMIISKEDWSLGGHFLSFLYESQADNTEDVQNFIEQLKTGEIKLITNDRFNQLLDVFDMVKQYNINKVSPLAADYVVDPLYLADGDGAFWFNGNWAWPNIAEFIDDDNTNEYGFMPIPLTDDENDFANNMLLGTGSKQILIDKVVAAEQEQQAAKDFFNWLVYDEEGQQAQVITCNLVPAFRNIELEPNDPLGKVIKSYVTENKTVFGPLVPADHWSILGAQMQQYLADKISREDLATAIESYWLKQQ